MEELVIRKVKIPDLIQELIKTYKVFLPTKTNGDYFHFNELQTVNEELLSFWDYRNTKISPKEIFFPQTEILFSFAEKMESLGSNRQLLTIILGIRPCDARAISFLDKVFAEPLRNGEPQTPSYIDPYYLERRQKSTIVSLACSNPQITCFCTSLNGKPDGEEGSDIILYDLGEEFLVKVISKTGEKLIDSFAKWFKKATKSHIAKKNKFIDFSLKRIHSTIDCHNIKEKLDESFNATFWGKIHLKCLGCGICTYLCPTCYCFDITDEVRNKQGKRMRCWDSCMFSLFTLHASGHNPRLTYKERMRQRIMHKFNYCPVNFNGIFCVGCGRCIRNCPVNLDLREIIKDIR